MSFEERGRKNEPEYPRGTRYSCNCGWEVRFGYGVAVTLAIFEAKRFFVLILEIFAEWQIVRFAGGLKPVIFTLVDVSVGFPTALLAIRTIRSRKIPRCCTETRRSLKCLLLLTAICAAMNIATLISIGLYTNVRQEALIGVFNNSMRLYVNAASHKYTVDEIQFVFRCCGHSSYEDWFLFDWQRVDYAAREEMMDQNEISDEEYRDRSVPFSCCDLRAMAPCVHTEILDEDVRTINTNGCARIVGPVILRIVIVAYVMTSTLVVTQLLLAFLITKIIRRIRPKECRTNYFPTIIADNSRQRTRDVSSNTNTESRRSVSSPSNRRRRIVSRTKKTNEPPSKRIKRVSPLKRLRSKNTNVPPSTVHPPSSINSSCSSFSSLSPSRPIFSKKKLSNRRNGLLEAARIQPSTHVEHTISRGRLSVRDAR